MSPDKLGNELRRDSAAPLEGTFVSVQSTVSSPRDLHARIETRWEANGGKEPVVVDRWSARRRLAFLVLAGVAAWVALVFAIWSLFQIIL